MADKRSSNLAEKVLSRLSAEIRGGRLAPGARLPTEQELTSTMGVSRTVVREAVAALRADGLVVTRRGSGAYVADNPTGPTPSTRSRSPQHVVRGAAKNWSVTYREGVPYDRRRPYVGFRCVLTVEAATAAPVIGNPTPTAPQPPGKGSTPPIPF